jgi:hypothetical protein
VCVAAVGGAGVIGHDVGGKEEKAGCGGLKGWMSKCTGYGYR